MDPYGIEDLLSQEYEDEVYRQFVPVMPPLEPAA